MAVGGGGGGGYLLARWRLALRDGVDHGFELSEGFLEGNLTRI
jgi:hypothetical protein